LIKACSEQQYTQDPIPFLEMERITIKDKSEIEIDLPTL
jgi:hypothetical protein